MTVDFFQLLPVTPTPVLWRDALEALKVVGPTMGALVGGALTMRKLWNGNAADLKAATAEINGTLAQHAERAEITRTELNAKIDAFSLESRVDRAKLHEDIVTLVDRTSRIEGSCTLHGNLLRAQIGVPLEPTPTERRGKPRR